ncbi:hypothetical protein QJQ45_025601 [Haematococcus lacustris]|nr:hypothetical protein QJQ45_025601 [Haematococcus lacustris]
MPRTVRLTVRPTRRQNQVRPSGACRPTVQRTGLTTTITHGTLIRGVSAAGSCRPKWWKRGSTTTLCFGWRPAARGRCSPACCWGSWCAAASRVTVLADGQELLEETPAEDAFIPVLAERNLYLQLGRGTPPPGMQSRPSLGVVAVWAAHPGLRDELNAAHHIKLDTRAIYGLMRAAGMLPADITSLTKFRNGVAGPKDSEVANRWIAFLPDQSLWPNDGQTFAQVVHTDGVTVSMLFTRPKPAGPPDELPRMGKQEGAVNPLAHLDADWLGCDPGKTNMAIVAHEERYPSGAVESVWQRGLTAGHYYRQSGITQHAKVSKAWLAGQCAVASHQLHRLAAAVPGVRRHDAGDLARHVGRAVQAALIQRQIPATVRGARVRCNSAATGRPLALAYGSAGFSGSGSIGSRGVPVKQMLREACKQFPGRVVMVHELRTSRVSSARTNVMAGQAESFSNGIRFYDRDVSAALDIRRIAAGPGRAALASSAAGWAPCLTQAGQARTEARPGHHKHNMASVRALSPKIGPASPRGFSNHISTRSRVATACLPRAGTVATVSLCALFALSFFGSIITMHAQTSPVSAAAPSTFAANQQYQDELLAAIRMRKEALEPMVQAPDVVVGEGAVPSPAPTPAEAPPTLAVEATVAEPAQPQPTADPPAAAEPAPPQPAASAVLAATPTPQAAPAMGVPEPADPLPGPAAQPAEPAAAPAPASPAAATPQAPVQAAAAEVAPEVSAPSAAPAPSPAVSGGEPAPMEVATTQAPPSNAALALGAVAVLAVAAVAVAGGNKAADQPEQPSTAQSPNTDAGGAVTRTSNTTHNASTMRKLVKELSDLHDQPPEGIRVIVNDANVWDVAFEVEGPSATPFEGGVFKGRLVLGPDFPVAPPKGFFITKIFHPNVSQSGEICVNVLKKDWTADTGLRHVLVVIKCLLVDPNPESALNEEAGRLLLEDYEEYAGKARLMTSIHARRGHGPLATSNGHANLVPVTAANDSCATQKSSVITDISMSPASKKSRGDMLPKPAAQVAASKVKKSLKRL